MIVGARFGVRPPLLDDVLFFLLQENLEIVYLCAPRNLIKKKKKKKSCVLDFGTNGRFLSWDICS